MKAAPPPDDNPNPLVGGRPWAEIVPEIFAYTAELESRPPPGLSPEDAVHLGGFCLLWASLARHADAGPLRAETMLTVSCFSVLSVAGYRSEQFGSPEAKRDWGRWLDWRREVWPEDGLEGDQHAIAVRAEYERAKATVLRGIFWTGELVKGYAEAARMYWRGGWPGVVRKAKAAGVASGFSADAEGEVLAALEGMRMSQKSPLARRADGQILPSFGPPLDLLKSDKPKPAEPMDESTQKRGQEQDVLPALDKLREHREFAEFERFLREFPARKCRSEYAPLVTAYAWDLLTGRTNPERLAKELDLSPRVMRREWDRHLARLEHHPRWGEAVKRARAAM